MSEDFQERRRFRRIVTDKPVVITVDEDCYTGMMLDISLRGLLFLGTGDTLPSPGSAAHALIKLDGDHCCLELDGTIAHVNDRHIGVHCISIDLENAAKLRRMVELNLADHKLLERELTELASGHS